MWSPWYDKLLECTLKTDKKISALKNSKEARDREEEAEGSVDVGEVKGVLTSPNFSMDVLDQSYPRNVHETNTIEVPKGKKIKIQFSHYEVEPCCGDYVRITDGDGTVLKEDKYKPTKMPIVSRTGTVHVLFHSDSSIQKKGWRLEWGESYTSCRKLVS